MRTSEVVKLTVNQMITSPARNRAATEHATGYERSISLAVLFVALLLPLRGNAAELTDDEELYATLHATVIESVLTDAPHTLPATFLESELDQSDKNRIIKEMAERLADCQVAALKQYAEILSIPVSELIGDDGTVRPKSYSRDYLRSLDFCRDDALAFIGASYN